MGPAFGRRCIPSGCVAPPSNTPGIVRRRALPAGRLAALGATPPFMRWVLISDVRDLTQATNPRDHPSKRSRGRMEKSRILSFALAALLLTPAVGLAGQGDRFDRLRERAEFRREMRDLARERVRERAEIRREQTRLRKEFR